MNNGFVDQARPLAERWVEVFEPYDYIVSPSASCVSMVREQFSRIPPSGGISPERRDKVTHRTYDFVEFLTKVLKADFRKFQLPHKSSFTYHYTCHNRGIGMGDEGVKLLKQLGNVDFRELEKTDQCCGFGGTFAVKYPAISGAIVEDKVQCIAATGARTTICNDAGCSMNIGGMCHRHGIANQTRHLAEVLAEAMGIDCDQW